MSAGWRGQVIIVSVGFTLAIVDSLTIERTQAPGNALITKTLKYFLSLLSDSSALKLGGHIMFIDTKFNSLLTTLANVYVNFSTTALKMLNYIRSMNPRPSETLIQRSIHTWHD